MTRNQRIEGVEEDGVRVSMRVSTVIPWDELADAAIDNLCDDYDIPRDAVEEKTVEESGK